MLSSLPASAVGAHGVIWRYNGSSWSAMDPGTDKHFYAVSGASSSAVWAVGWAGTIYKYNGTSWSPQTSGTTNHLRGVWAVDANTVFAVGFGGKILKTTNGGTDWSSLTSGTSSNLYAIEGASSSVIWAIGASGTIRKTVNGGTDWSGQTSPYSRFLTSISVQDSSNVWIGGQSADAQTLISTSNGGSNWSDESGRVVWQTMGWPNNDVCINGIKVHSNDEVTIACGEYNENTDGVAATASHDMITFSNCKLNRNGDDGLDLYNCEDAFIEDCEIIDNDPSFSAAGDGDKSDYDELTVTVNPSGVLMSDDFNDNDISDWTTVAGTGWDAAGGQATKLADDTVDAAIEKGGFSVSSGTITLEFDLTVAGDWRPGNAGLVDTSGNGIYLPLLVGDTYVEIGAKNTTDNALTGTGGAVSDATCDPSTGITIRYEVNLDTGEVKGYVDDNLEHTETLNLSGVGAITDVVLQAKKNWYLDNVVVSSSGGGPPSNTAPTADAGSNDSITLPNYATLDGTVSDDGLPNPPASVTTTWSKDSGPGNVTFGDASAVDTTAGFSENGVYVLQLLADDGTLTDSDTVQITVNHLAPTADAGSDDSITLPNYATLDGTVSDDDLPDPPASVTTTWSKDSGPGTVTFGDSSAVDTTAGFSEAGTYVLKLAASDSSLSNFDLVQIVVNAEAGGTGPFQEEGGTVVMEAENYDTSDQRSENNPWSEETEYAGYVGDGYMEAPGGGSKTWATGSELTYEIDFSTAGTYYIWMRRYADSKNENAALVGLDGTKIGGTFDDEQADYDQWIWKEHGTTVYISAAQHTFNLRKEEKNYGVDRIILTDDSGYTPSGNGPAESSRQ